MIFYRVASLCMLIAAAPVTYAQTAGGNNTTTEKVYLFKANHPYIQYTGRIDFSDSLKPRFWAPGVYIHAKFRGTSCEVEITDEVLWGTSHNYLEIAIDNNKPFRVQTTGKNNSIIAAHDLPDKVHSITICKNTEAGIGYLEFEGLKCEALVPPSPKPMHKIECIGNSITCGMGSDLSEVPCDKGQWYDQHNAWFSYGAIASRTLNAQWHLSSVSGIGVIHSCCNMTITMPPVFDKINMRQDSIKWDFKNYQPDVVTICLGQNDGIQDSATFCAAYVNFIKQLRNYYPDATIICLNSPMADISLTAVLKKYISAVEKNMTRDGDRNVHHYFFSKRYYHGCGSHPDLREHGQMAHELAAFIKKVKHW